MRTTALTLTALLLAGCGAHSASTSTAPATTSGGSTSQTRAVDVHGELVDQGGTLAFFEDGAAEAYEIADASALSAAGLHEGFTLQLQGDVEPNLGGQTALSEAIRVVTFALDDVVVTARQLVAGTLRDHDGRDLTPLGPLASAVLAHPTRRPVRITGRIDPSYMGGLGVVITSWRPCVTLRWSHVTPLLGDESFEVLDLQGTGAYSAASFTVMGSAGLARTHGAGRELSAAVLADLQGSLTRANLPNQAAVFQPTMIYPDHPHTNLTLSDAQGDTTITIYSGASVPRDLDALVQKLRGMPALVPTLETVAKGDQSQITGPELRAARTVSAWNTLWQAHDPSSRPPLVDFATDVVVGVFDGQRNTGGFSVELTRVERIGPHLHFTAQRTSPTGPAPSVLTFPFHLVRVDAPAGAELYVDGVRVP